MVDLIFGYCATAAILIAGIGIYAVLVSRILPGFFLSPLKGRALSERGVRKCVFPGGRSVTYEPKLNIRKYINQYVLFAKDGRKYMKCKINDKVKSLKYEVVVFDRKDRATDAFEITETVGDDGFTAEVMLPAHTSYIHLQLCEVNGVELKEKDYEVYSRKNAVRFISCVFALTLAVGLAINYVIVEVCDVLLGYFKCVPEVNWLPTFLVMLVVSALASLWIFSLNVVRPFRILRADKSKTE
jgi:hypothetical protein